MLSNECHKNQSNKLHWHADMNIPSIPQKSICPIQMSSQYPKQSEDWYIMNCLCLVYSLCWSKNILILKFDFLNLVLNLNKTPEHVEFLP